jgi:hypothetical protein
LAHTNQIKTAPPAPPTDGSLFNPREEGHGIEDGVRALMRKEDEHQKAVQAN